MAPLSRPFASLVVANRNPPKPIPFFFGFQKDIPVSLALGRTFAVNSFRAVLIGWPSPTDPVTGSPFGWISVHSAYCGHGESCPQ